LGTTTTERSSLKSFDIVLFIDDKVIECFTKFGGAQVTVPEQQVEKAEAEFKSLGLTWVRKNSIHPGIYMYCVGENKTDLGKYLCGM
jgi:hypothetical protein